MHHAASRQLLHLRGSPQTCRDYDCRVFAATGIAVDRQVQPDIARRVDEWEFQFETKASREQHPMLREAAAFLQNNRSLFPAGSLPSQPGSLAALAVRIWRQFAESTTKTHNRTAIARAIAPALER
jgi:hypothetical protein